MKTLQKLALVTAMASIAPMASATGFYVNIGTDFTVDDSNKATNANCISGADNTCTGYKDDISVTYQSNSIVEDMDGSLDVSDGDKIVSSGGLAVGPVSTNLVTALIPSSIGGGPSDNGYISDWVLSFTFDDLTGTVVDFGGGLILPSYTSGEIDLLVSFDNGSTFKNFMDLSVANSTYDPGQGDWLINGFVDFTNADVVGGADDALKDMFHTQTGGCTGAASDSYYDLWSACGGLAVSFRIDQNADALGGGSFIGINADGNAEFDLGLTEHNGGVKMSVPEPGTLALMGAALMGMGSVARRRSKKAA